MSTPKFITNTTTFNAVATIVWDALVNPGKTKIYMFGCETVSDWKPGSELIWRGHYEGKDMVFVKGHIVEIAPYQKLVYTVFDPNSTMEDIPANYLTVSYILKEEQGVTTLTVTQGDYSTVADGERRYQESYNGGEGWNPILEAIKKMIEN